MLKIISSQRKHIYSSVPKFAFGKVSKYDFTDPNFSKVTIVGSGFAGLTAIAHIPKIATVGKFEMRAFDSQSFVSYLPHIDLLPFGFKTKDEIQKPILQVINETTALDFVEVESIQPENNSLMTIENKEYHYDYLVLAAGLVPNFGKVHGLKQALEDRDCPVITTANITDVEKCQREFEIFYSGKVLFYNDKKSKNYASAANVCMLFDEYLRKRKGGGLRSMSEFSYITNDKSVLPDVSSSLALKKVFQEKEIDYDDSNLELLEIQKEARKAVFLDLNTGKKIEREFDLLFVNPGFELPGFLNNLSTVDGLLDIDSTTLVHNKHANVFGLGHCARDNKTIVTAKSILEQSMVMSANLELSLMAATNDKLPEKYARYHGETHIPFFTGGRKALVAEIDPLRPVELQDNAKVPSSIEFMKEVYLNPKIYFKLLTQGVWYGESKFSMPKFQTS